jgi:hypothetical protein
MEQGRKFIKKIRNTQVQRILLGIPCNHKHLRAVLELTDGTTLILHEATLASIVRAFLSVKLDPVQDAVEFLGTELAERRVGFAEYQLLMTEKTANQVKTELTTILEQKEGEDA